MTTKRLALVAALGALVLTGCQGQMPVCQGNADYAYDGIWDGSEYPAEEDAAIYLLETTFGIDISDVVLLHVRGAKFRAVEVNGRRLEHPPTLEIEPIGEGFAPTGVSC